MEVIVGQSRGRSEKLEVTIGGGKSRCRGQYV